MAVIIITYLKVINKEEIIYTIIIVVTIFLMNLVWVILVTIFLINKIKTIKIIFSVKTQIVIKTKTKVKITIITIITIIWIYLHLLIVTIIYLDQITINKVNRILAIIFFNNNLIIKVKIYTQVILIRIICLIIKIIKIWII